MNQYWVVQSSSYLGITWGRLPPLQLRGHKMVAMATPVAYQRGHEICNLWPHISKIIRSIHSKLGACIEQELPVTVTQFW